MELQDRDRSTPRSMQALSSRGGVEPRRNTRRNFTRRFLYSDLEPLAEAGIAPDPHPEGPSSLPVEAPEDVRKELANARRMEGLKKATVSRHLPRLVEVTAARESLLEAAGQTAQGSKALLLCEEKEFAARLRDGEALALALDAQRRDIWYDRAKSERDDLDREVRMLDEAMKIIRGHKDVASVPQVGSRWTGEGSDSRKNVELRRYASSSNGSSVVDTSATNERVHPDKVPSSDPVPETLSKPGTPDEGAGGDSAAQTTLRKMEEIFERQTNMLRLTEAQDLLICAKKRAMDLMFLADEEEQESNKEADKLRGMQRAPAHSEEALFDSRAHQRRVWMAKNEVALQSRLRYQEAVEELHRVRKEWGPALGLEVSVGSSSPTASSSAHTSIEGGGKRDAMERAISAGESERTWNETICLWVIGVIAVNVSGETLKHAYYGAFSELPTVPAGGWTAFDEGSTGITVHHVVPSKLRKGVPAGVDTWVVDGTPFPEVNGRYMERGRHDGAPRYRNPNNIFLFRHRLRRSEELGITRQTCLPENELIGEDLESAATTVALSLGQEVSGRFSLDFSRLVKTSLQTINLDREERVRLNHQRVANAVARIDTTFQEQMSQASATLDSVENAQDGSGGSSVTAVGVEKNRDLAMLEASDSAKLTFQDHTDEGDRVIVCEEHGVPPLCKRWVARACPKNQIHCRCRHYFISVSERECMVAWREGKDAKAELEVLVCIAKRETLLSEAEKDAAACSSRFLSETRTAVEERDVASLLRLLDQLRLASVRVVEAVCVWRKDVQSARIESLSNPATRSDSPPERAPGTSYSRDRPEARAEDNASEKQSGVFLQGTVSGTLDEGDAASAEVHIQGGTEYADQEARCTKSTQRSQASKRKLASCPRGSPTSAGCGDGGGNDRRAKGKWVVTMMVPGRKLWGSSPAMMSQYKRFRRSRQDPKIARDQLYLGVFPTKTEAFQAYDDALSREATKQRSSVLRMPKKRIVTRGCGKHMAVQSNDTPPGRPCEQCAAEALNGGVKHSPPYIWNNSNYLLKMTEDLDFLGNVDPLLGFLGDGFELKGNPFLLAPPAAANYLKDLDVDSRRNAPRTAAQQSTQFLDAGNVYKSPPHTAPARPYPQREKVSEELTTEPFQRLQSPLHCARPTSTRPSPGISAVTTPRATWAEEGDSFLDSSVFESDFPYHADGSVGGSPMETNGAPPGCSVDTQVPAAADWSIGIVQGGLPGLGASVASSPGQAFGRPSTQVTRFANGVQAWCGETAQGGQFVIPFLATVASSPPGKFREEYNRPPLTPAGVGPGFNPRREAGTMVDVLDLVRVEEALAVLHEEEDIADAMAGRPPRERNPPTSKVGGSSKGITTTTPGEVGGGPVPGHEDIDIQTMSTTAGQDKTGLGSGELVAGTGKTKRGLRDVLAVYKHRGAQLVLAQSRKRHPFRQDGVFCRADRGEWAGQVHMSVNTKNSVARRLLDKGLERRNEQRGRVGRMMRRLIEQGQPIHRLKGPRLRALLTRAHRLGGDRLTIDIMEAEAALRLYGRVEQSATVIEALTRGVLGREASRRDLALRRKAAKMKKITTSTAGIVAEEVVLDVAHKAMRRARQFIRRPVTASVGVYQDGRKMIVGAVPVEERSFAGGAPKAATEWRQLCSACQGRSAQRVRSCRRDADEAFRGVCSCATVRPPESIKLTAYDPTTGEQVYMVTAGERLRNHLFNKRMDGYGKTSSKPTTSAIVRAAARLLPLPWDAVLGYGNPKREAGAKDRCTWEPCYEARLLATTADITRIDLGQLSQAARMADEAAAKAASEEEAARALHETWQMSAADIAGHRRDLFVRFMVASEKSREALAFSWRSVQQIENRDAEDWTQAWDPFENGNNWRQLIKRRDTDRALSGVVKAGLVAKDSVYRAREERAASAYRSNKSKAKADRAAETLRKGTKLMERLSIQAQAASDAAKEGLKLLTVVARPTVKAAGRLQKRLVIDGDGHEQWDALFREGMVLETPALTYLGAKESKRRFCVATIRRDAKTGMVKITAAGEDKALDLHSATMSAGEVMSVVSEKVGGRRGKELLSPIVMEGGYAAIRRVEEARKKEVLQVLVDSLKIDIYANELAIGKLFFLRRAKGKSWNTKTIRLVRQEAYRPTMLEIARATTVLAVLTIAEVRSLLLETLWHRDAVARRSSGRGTEIFRQFHRLGAGWATIAVYETWGDLFFEAYDPAVACTMTLQTSLREVLGSLWSERSAAAAYLHAVRTCTFPPKLLRQILKRLDVILPAEQGRWWRRQVDGETPHLAILFRKNTHSYRGPIWKEDRYTSGKYVSARVLVSARGNFLVEMEPRSTGLGQGGCGNRDTQGSPFSAGDVLRLEVTARELRTIFRGLDNRDGLGLEGGEGVDVAGPHRKECLLAPQRRVDVCRYLLDHIALEDACSVGNSVEQLSPAAKEADAELQMACKSYKEWVEATSAPVELDPFPDQDETIAGGPHEKSSLNDPFFRFSLVLRPDLDPDEHLLPIHEGPWSADGKAWFHAKVSFVQGDPAMSTTAAVEVAGSRNGRATGGAVSNTFDAGLGCKSDSEGAGSENEMRRAGLSVTLRPEGAGQRSVRWEQQAKEAMAVEDKISMLVGKSMARLEREAICRERALEEGRASSRLVSAIFAAKVRHQNRLQTILDDQANLAKKWAEQDVASGRRSAWDLLPLLRLETRDDGPTLVLAPPVDGHRPLHVFRRLRGRGGESATVANNQTTTSSRPQSAFRRGKKAVRDKGASVARDQETQGRARCGKRGIVLPAPLRQPSSGFDCFSRGCRYRGEGRLEREPSSAGVGGGRDKPSLLAQQVARFEGNTTAIVRVVLETPMTCDAVHLTSSSSGTRCEPCLARCVLRVESYLTDSSQCVSLRVRASSCDGEANASTTEGPHTEHDHLVQKECVSRKRLLQELGEAREAEMKAYITETAAVVRESSAAALTKVWNERNESEQLRVDLTCVGDEDNARGNDAFSSLLVRANVGVPLGCILLGSGSWRQTIAEVVGYPPGQELRVLKVGGSVVFCLGSSCPAAFNVKAKNLLGISVHGDVVWVQARTDESVMALLEADRQLMGREIATANQLITGRQKRAGEVAHDIRRYAEAVKKEARRLLPALSRSCFCASVNSEDKEAREVRSIMSRAWHSRASELGDPLEGAAAAEMGLPDALGVRPWHVAKDMLKMHVAACQIPGAACLVPCCRESRARALELVEGSTSDVNPLVFEELDRCMMRFWESKEYLRRNLKKTPVLLKGGDGGEDNTSHLPPDRSAMETTTGSEQTHPRRFGRALQALDRLTAVVGHPHAGVSAAFSTANSTIGDSAPRATRKPACAPGGAAAERCRIGFDMLQLLIGPDGNDATGRFAGVAPGEDVETAVLEGCSQAAGDSTATRNVARWIMGRLERSVHKSANGGKVQEILRFDKTHMTGVACISGARFLLTIGQLVDGSVSVAGHDPLSCQRATLVLSTFAMKTLCLSEGLEVAANGTSVGPIVARHLLRNAQRLLEVRSVDGVEYLALAGPQDDESLVSSTSSSVIVGFGVGSAGFLEGMDENNDDREGKRNDAPAVGQVLRQTKIECRVRRLEVGRKRAQERRRVAGGLRLEKAAKVYRDMHLTCEASALASATASFEELIQGGPDRSPVAGIGREHVVALHNLVMQEFEGAREGQRGSMQTFTDSHSGRTRTASKASSGPPDSENFGSVATPAQQHGRLSLDDTDGGEIESVGKTKKKLSRGGFAEGSLQTRRKQTLEGHGDGASLDQLLNAVDSLAKQAEQGSMGLVEFAAWWMRAVSKAEIELKMRFLTPRSKQSG